MTAATQTLLDSIAYIAWHGHRVRGEGKGWATIAQPPRDDLLNYVGLAHAGATYALAETACGVAADGLARTLDAYILLRGAEVRYVRRAAGELVARAKSAEAGLQAAAKAFAEGGRADVTVDVVVENGGGQSVFEGCFHYALRPRVP